MSDIRNFTPLWDAWEIEPISEDRLAIGEGSFGKVYKAFREDFGRRYECAIKHISLPQSDEEVRELLYEQLSDDVSIASGYYREIVENINNEIGIMHSLRGYTNIVAYEDHLIKPKANGIGYDIFMRMELLTALFEHVKRNALTDTDAAKMGIDICIALEVCAAKNLIHRDIKPQNIFVNSEGHYKLGDFGISRQLEKTTGGLTKIGTYSYMAPEVYRGDEYGANVDIYSLGLLLYRLTNGNRLPFLPLAPDPLRFDDNEKALARRMKGEDMPAPAFADEDFAKVILKMCAYDRNERYRTATEAKAALMQVDTKSKVLPFVASSGNYSLTGNSQSKSSSEGTISRFGDIPSYVASDSQESGTPPPPPKKKRARKQKKKARKKSSTPPSSEAKTNKARLKAVFGYVRELVGKPVFRKKFVRTITILGIVLGILLGLLSLLMFIISIATDDAGFAVAAIIIGIFGCIINALGLRRKKKALAIICLIFCVAAIVGSLAYSGYYIEGGRRYSYYLGDYIDIPYRYGNVFDYIF